LEFLYSLIHYFLVFIGTTILLKKKGLGLKDSYCHAGWLVLCVLYTSYKIFFLLEISLYTVYVDLCIDSYCLILIFKNFKFLITSFGKKHLDRKIIFILLFWGTPLLYGLILALLLQPTTIDVNSYHESRVLLLQQQNSYFLSAFNNICEVVYGWGYDLVLHNHLRFGTDRGLGIYGYISFICILGFLYNFFRQPKLDKFSSFLPCLMFLGLIEPVYQSFSAKNDLPGLLACLASYHAYTSWKKDKLDIYLILSFLALTWAVACKKTYLAFALPVILFWWGQWLKDKRNFKITVQQVAGFTLVLLFVSPLITYIYNLVLWGNWSGPTHFVEHHTNNSVILGTLANFFRYFFEIFHFPFFVEKFSSSLLGISPVNIINNCWINYVNPLFGSHGEGAWSFQVNWEQLEDSWFGPIGFLLLLYFIYSLFQRGENNQKEIRFLLISYLLAICAMLAWRPFNDRYFTLFFALAILLVRNLSMPKFLKGVLSCSCAFLFYWALLFNKNLPTFNFASLNLSAMLSDSLTNGILARSYFGTEKVGYTKIPDQVLRQIPPNSKIGMWIKLYCPHASVSRQLNSHQITPMNFKVDKNYNLKEIKSVEECNIAELGYIVHYGTKNEYFDNKKFTKLWDYENAQKKIWSLYKVIHT
jgi:hypothetical protein